MNGAEFIYEDGFQIIILKCHICGELTHIYTGSDGRGGEVKSYCNHFKFKVADNDSLEIGVKKNTKENTFEYA